MHCNDWHSDQSGIWMFKELLGSTWQLRCLDSSHKDCRGAGRQAGTGDFFTTFGVYFNILPFRYILYIINSRYLGKTLANVCDFSTHGWWTLATSTDRIRSCCTSAEGHLSVVGASAQLIVITIVVMITIIFMITTIVITIIVITNISRWVLTAAHCVTQLPSNYKLQGFDSFAP